MSSSRTVITAESEAPLASLGDRLKSFNAAKTPWERLEQSRGYIDEVKRLADMLGLELQTSDVRYSKRESPALVLRGYIDEVKRLADTLGLELQTSDAVRYSKMESPALVLGPEAGPVLAGLLLLASVEGQLSTSAAFTSDASKKAVNARIELSQQLGQLQTAVRDNDVLQEDSVLEERTHLDRE